MVSKTTRPPTRAGKKLIVKTIRISKPLFAEILKDANERGIDFSRATVGILGEYYFGIPYRARKKRENNEAK